MKGWMVAIALAGLPLAFTASADDLADAKGKCISMSLGAASSQATTPEQKAQVESMITNLCTCVTDKFGAMGDDGAKMIHVMAKITPEQATAGSTDPAVDKKNTTAILMADYGMSQADADAFYDRVNPEAEKIGAQCTQDAMQKAGAPATP